jgi:hypothetical protein
VRPPVDVRARRSRRHAVPVRQRLLPPFLFYEPTNCRPLAQAVERVRAHDAGMALFRLYTG